MEDEFSRTRLLIGDEGLQRLKASHVAVFGLGGVGSFAAEALSRAGVGALSLFDHDRVSLSNLNRQLIALHSTVGRYKTEVMRERILDINPQASVLIHSCFYGADNAHDFNLTEYDYIVDAIDTVTSKLILIENASKSGVRIISCMGAGNKLDPSRFTVSDIYDTSVCPLAKVMRRELKKRGIGSLKVVYSREEPIKPEPVEDARRSPPGSISFVPSAAGLIIAGEAIRDLIRG